MELSGSLNLVAIAKVAGYFERLFETAQGALLEIVESKSFSPLQKNHIG